MFLRAEAVNVPFCIPGTEHVTDGGRLLSDEVFREGASVV